MHIINRMEEKNEKKTKKLFKSAEVEIERKKLNYLKSKNQNCKKLFKKSGEYLNGQ